MKTKKEAQSQESDQQMEHIGFLISMLPTEEQERINTIEQFLRKYFLPAAEDRDEIQFEPITFRLLKYLLFTIIVNYQRESRVIAED